MVAFIVYDVLFLVIFCILTAYLLYTHKKNVQRQGWIFLFHTQVGIKFIDWTAKKFKKILQPLSYVVIASGYILMSAILWLMVKTVWTYVSTPIPEQLKNLPPIAPLLPYFPKLFKLESFFPPLYFTYFLVALAIVAVSHEMSHGIFARLWNIKVKTTGLAFFGPFFGAFVEPDEKKMQKAPVRHQLSILAAGTFANVLMTIIFGLLLWLFFAFSFAPSGVIFNTYAQAIIPVAGITMLDNHTINSATDLLTYSHDGLNQLRANNHTYFAPKGLFTKEIILKQENVVVFEDTPAIRVKLDGAITSIGGIATPTHSALSEVLSGFKAGQVVKVTTITSDGEKHDYTLTLAEKENGKAYLGIGVYQQDTTGFRGKLASLYSKIKDPNTHYAPTWDGNFVQFIYDLLWWIVTINILVALMNMLPVAVLDGGRFFYLTILGITRSEKWSKRAYTWITWFILFLLSIMMAKWLINFVK